MKINNKISISFLCMLMAQGINAQKTEWLGGQIWTNDVAATKQAGSLLVRFNMNMDNLDMPSNRQIVYTPLVINSDSSHIKKMPPIVISGRRQQAVYERQQAKKQEIGTIAVRRKNGTEQTVDYVASIPYEEWMDKAKVVLNEDKCGCGKILEQEGQELADLRGPARFMMAYVTPESEQKVRELEGRAYLDFVVDRTEINPSYRKNPTELRKIIATIDTVKFDPNTTINAITIHGYASPESPYWHNTDLANGRAAALKDYVKALYNFDEKVFTSVKSTPEDWDGLRRFVSENSINNKEEIIKLIDSNIEPDKKEARIKKIYPAEYEYMLKNWYPALRHSDYTVRYTIRSFSLEEAKQIFKTKPQQLSENELFMVAQSYEPGSAEYNEVFETTVRLYPNSEVANLNAACNALNRGDLEQAKIYLDRISQSKLPETIHARGVYEYMKGNKAAAISLLEEAKSLGLEQAENNLKEIKN